MEEHPGGEQRRRNAWQDWPKRPGASGDKRRPGNQLNCRLSSPGGGSDRNYDWRADGRGSETEREKGKRANWGTSGRGRVARR